MKKAYEDLKLNLIELSVTDIFPYELTVVTDIISPLIVCKKATTKYSLPTNL